MTELQVSGGVPKATMVKIDKGSLGFGIVAIDHQEHALFYPLPFHNISDIPQAKSAGDDFQRQHSSWLTKVVLTAAFSNENLEELAGQPVIGLDDQQKIFTTSNREVVMAEI